MSRFDARTTPATFSAYPGISPVCKKLFVEIPKRLFIDPSPRNPEPKEAKKRSCCLNLANKS
ncbi:hypothetical protein ACLNBI_25545, partial [Pseudomonas guariconensis]|uniref:hypothetical protein n=1 Tax=Pseudomonas guariconensis TaxID=1288410 RepID=UPI0039E93024